MARKRISKLTPEQGFTIVADVFERVHESQHKRLVWLLLDIPRIHKLATDNGEFWADVAIQCKAPKHERAEKIERKPGKKTVQLVAYVNAKLSRMTLPEAIEEARRCKEWKGISAEALKRRYLRNRSKQGISKG